MMEDPWKEKTNNIKVRCKIPNSVAENYYCPNVQKILTKIIPDSADFIPSYNLNHTCADLIANLPNQNLFLSINQSSIIDCGFSMEVIKGYRARIQIHPDLSNTGLVINTSSFEGQGRVKIFVINILNETIEIRHKDKIAQIFIEPIYFFDWDCFR